MGEEHSVYRCIESLTNSLFDKGLSEKIIEESNNYFLDMYKESSKINLSEKVNCALEKTVEYILIKSHEIKKNNYHEIDWDFKKEDEWWRCSWK